MLGTAFKYKNMPYILVGIISVTDKNFESC